MQWPIIYLLSIHHCPHTDSKGLLGDLRQVALKEASVGHDGVLVQRLNPRPGDQTGARLVEGNVTIRTYTYKQLKHPWH